MKKSLFIFYFFSLCPALAIAMKVSWPACLPIPKAVPDKVAEAIKAGNIDPVEKFLQNDGDINRSADKHKKSLLIIAAEYGQPGLVSKFIITYKANPNIADSIIDYSPLMWALRDASLPEETVYAVVKALLEGGADPKYKSPLGITPLQKAR